MNAQRRKIIEKALALVTEARELLEDVRDGEQEAYDNLPEPIQESDKGYAMSDNIDNLEEIIGYLEDAEGWEEA